MFSLWANLRWSCIRTSCTAVPTAGASTEIAYTVYGARNFTWHSSGNGANIATVIYETSIKGCFRETLTVTSRCVVRDSSQVWPVKRVVDASCAVIGKRLIALLVSIPVSNARSTMPDLVGLKKKNEELYMNNLVRGLAFPAVIDGI